MHYVMAIDPETGAINPVAAKIDRARLGLVAKSAGALYLPDALGGRFRRLGVPDVSAGIPTP
jgi:hypothetical protein